MIEAKAKDDALFRLEKIKKIEEKMLRKL